MYAIAQGPYQTRETFLKWAPLIYLLVWLKMFPAVPFEEPSPDLYVLVSNFCLRILMCTNHSSIQMVNNLATLRCAIKQWMRWVVESFLGFQKAAQTQADVDHNLGIYKQVHPNAFHCMVSRWFSTQDN